MNKIVKSISIIVVAVAVLFVFRDYLLISAIKVFYQKDYKGEKLPLTNISDSLQTVLTSYVQNNYKSPEQYIVDKFKMHDIVFVGEYHRVKHDVELVCSLVPMLYDNGVYNLGIEFACAKDQALIDSLIFSKEYDRKLANRILFDGDITWGYQEYADIFNAAWSVNTRPSSKNKRFRVWGLNIPQYTGDPDVHMAEVIARAFVDTNEKALIYCGMHHAFTNYRQPILETGKPVQLSDSRAGNRIETLIHDRAFTICLHHPWAGEEGYSSDYGYPAGGIIDTLMKTMPREFSRIGFDTDGSPFGDIACRGCVYQNGYEDLRLKDFCDGYIYQKPLSEYEGVAVIKNFINKENIVEARSRFPNNGFKLLFDHFGPAFWNYAISMDADLKRGHQFSKYK